MRAKELGKVNNQKYLEVDVPHWWWKTAKVREALDCGNTKVWQLAKLGKLPKPFKTPVGVRWDARAVIAFIEAETKRARGTA
jgi:predicted DNA-binding transcriptional regulator AlpA